MQPDHQYRLGKILLVWLLSALPMGLLAFVVTPWVASKTGWQPLIVYWIAIIIGLVWQFILSLMVLKHEGQEMSWKAIMARTRYRKPVHPGNGKASYRLLWWTVPFIILSALIQSGIVPLPDLDGLIEPVIKDLPKYDLSGLSAAEYKGKWWVLGLFLITCVFNYFLGEEMIYRGVLLPKMNGVFGQWDWFANGILFGFYHLHKPQVILSTALYFGLVFALPSKLFQSSWMALIIHGLEGVLGIIMVLGLILGS